MAKQLANRLLGIVTVLLMMMAMPLEASAGPVTVKSGIVNGTVAVDKATANPGETVTVTVTPDMGYYAVKENVKAEMTVDGGSAQAPRLNVLSNMPVGRYVEVQGNAPADVSGEASYTFTMPDAPYGVQVSAEFLARIPISIDMLPLIPDQPYTGSEITPDVTIMDGDIELIPDKDYTIEFSDNVGPGQATFTITGKGKYTGQKSRNFTIYRETYEIRWGQGDPWPETNMIPMTEDAATGKWVVADQEMAATSSFKVVKKYNAGAEPVYTWYGAQADGMFWITSEKLGTEITLGTPDDYRNLYFPYDGIYTFTFDPTTSKLVVSGNIFYKVTVANGIEYGIVVANPISAKAGDPVTITATPEIGYKLSHLYVNGENVIANEENGVYTYTFNMPATDVTVNATFSLKLYSITKAPTEHGSFDLSMEAGVMGDDIQIFPEPEANYVVDQIIVTAEDGSPVEVNDLNIFKMPASNVTVAVTFKLADYTITVAPTQNGTVEAPASAHYGEEVELTVTPEPGYELETLTYTVEGGETVDIENGKFNMPASNVTINATFKEIVVEYSYEVVTELKCIVMNDPDGPSGLAPEGKTLTMRIVPDSGTKLKEVIVNKVIGNGPERVEEEIAHNITYDETGNTLLSFVMPAANVEIHVFCADLHIITLDDGGGVTNFATIDNDMAQAIEGETVTVRTHVNEEYKVSEIYYTYTLEGEEYSSELTEGENGVYTFLMPDAPVTVVVRFDYIIPRHQVRFFPESDGGTISVTADRTPINSGDEVAEISIIEVTVTPDEGYELDDLKVYEGLHNPDDDFSGVHDYSWDIQEGKYRFEMPNTDVTIIATFKQTEIELEGVSFGAEHQWATYYNGAQNLALPQNVKAYVVNSVIGDAVDITEIDYIPAGVGVLLYSELPADHVAATLFNGTTGTYNSIIVGSDEEQSITDGYVLYNNAFVLTKEGTIAAHRCYLPIASAAGAPRMLRIGVTPIITAIDDIVAQGNVAGIKYVNMSGATSNEPFQGVNIAIITMTDGSTRTVKVVK